MNEIVRLELQKLCGKYNTNFQPEAYQTYARKTSYLDDNIFEKDPKNESLKAYLAVLSNSMLAYMHTKTKFDEVGDHDLSRFSVAEFVVDFEKFMQIKFEQERSGLELLKGERRKPFEGKSLEGVSKYLLKSIGHLDKSMSDIWADQLFNDRLSLDQIKSVVTEARNRIECVENPEGLTDQTRKDLEKTVMAQATLKKAIDKRTFGWRIWPGNWPRWYRENQYMKVLDADIQDYKNRQLLPNDPNYVAEADRQTFLNGKAAEISEFVKSFDVNSLSPSVVSDEKVTSAEAAQELFDNKSLTDNMVDAVSDLIDTAEFKTATRPTRGKNIGDSLKFPKNMQTLYVRQVHEGIQRIINDMWKGFGETTDPAAREQILKEGVEKIFRTTNTKMTMLNLNEKDGYVMSQKIADMYLNRYSPVKSDPQYEKYGNNFYMKNYGPMEMVGQPYNFTPEAHIELIKERLPVWDAARKYLGIDEPTKAPTVEEVQAWDKVLKDRKSAENARLAKIKAEEKAYEEEVARKKNEEKEAADKKVADGKKEGLSIPEASESKNVGEISPKVEKHEAPVKANVKN